jgi:hypothetical protein
MAAVLGACGGDEERPAGPGPGAATFTTPGSAASLDEGASCPEPARGEGDRARDGADVRVAGLDAEPARRPEELEVAREITLTCLVWEDWGASRASARGVAQVLDCQPSCAQAITLELPATLTVAGLQECEGRRFYRDAELELGGERTRPAAAYLEAPC